MAMENFNVKAGSKEKTRKIGSYFIKLADTGETDPLRRSARPYEFRRALSDWIAQETGCAPGLEVVKDTVQEPVQKLYIQCSEDFLEKVKARFPAEIANAEYIPTRDEIVARGGGCWKPPAR